MDRHTCHGVQRYGYCTTHAWLLIASNQESTFHQLLCQLVALMHSGSSFVHSTNDFAAIASSLQIIPDELFL